MHLSVISQLNRTIAVCLLIILHGCAAVSPYSVPSLAAEDAMCFKWLETVEAKLQEYDVKDAEAVSVKGFPQLRINRFLASMTDRLAASDSFAEWLELMRQLDYAGKQVEFANLPSSIRKLPIFQPPIAGSFDQGLEDCGKRLNRLSENNARHNQILTGLAKVPDAYQDWQRVVGLYPLARYVAAIGIKRLHRELNASFKIQPDRLPIQGQLIRYSASHRIALSPAQISAMLHAAYNNPLGIPQLSSLQLQQLFTQYAPVWEIDTRNETDKPGRVGLDSDRQPGIDITEPVVYVKHAYARWQGKVLLQLVYQMWFPAREKTGALDLYGGPLDSVIWRVTLGPEGFPLAFDSIHGCGCYYLLFPGQGYRAIPPQDDAESVLSPKSIQDFLPGSHVLLRLQSRTHYLQQVSIVDNTVNTSTKVQLIDSDNLRSIQMPDGTRQSLYGVDGIIAASARLERLLLWPFGVASPGAMRQWGTHAIAFTGKRHFDDPFLLEYLIEKE
jgi:hypothetical protein